MIISEDYIFIPVYDDKGNIQLYDIYINEEWHGSRRTIEQCHLYIEFWFNEK